MQSIINWVAQAERREDRREEKSKGLAAAERDELVRLRRENRQLRLERDILFRAAAWFARETGAIPSGSSPTFPCINQADRVRTRAFDQHRGLDVSRGKTEPAEHDRRMIVSFGAVTECAAALSLSAPVGPISRSGCQRRHHLLEWHDIQHPPEIVSECRKTEFTPNVLQTAHQERALVHPLLDRPKWMFNRFAATFEDIGALCQTDLHPIQNGFVVQARDRAKRAARRA